MWKDGDGLEPDGEGPSDLKGRELIVEQEGKNGDGAKDVGELKGIKGGVVCRSAGWSARGREGMWAGRVAAPVLELHEVEGVGR